MAREKLGRSGAFRVLVQLGEAHAARRLVPKVGWRHWRAELRHEIVALYAERAAGLQSDDVALRRLVERFDAAFRAVVAGGGLEALDEDHCADG